MDCKDIACFNLINVLIVNFFLEKVEYSSLELVCLEIEKRGKIIYVLFLLIYF